MRQWACFPSQLGRRQRLASPQLFRLMVETTAGRLVVANITMHQQPDQVLVKALAELVDSPKFVEMPKERIQGEFDARHGYSIELLDNDLEQDNPLAETNAIPRSIASAISSRQEIDGPMATLRNDIACLLGSEWECIRGRFVSGLNASLANQARAAGGLSPSAYNVTKLSTLTTEGRRVCSNELLDGSGGGQPAQVPGDDYRKPMNA